MAPFHVSVTYSQCTGLIPVNFELQGVARNLLRGTNQEIWGMEVPSGVQAQNMETKGAVTKIDLR